MTKNIEQYLLHLQSSIVSELEKLELSSREGKTFLTHHWEHHEGGGGKTQVIQEGAVFEKGGVNFSHVQGLTLPPSATQRNPLLAGRRFDAMGISLVIHPRNPYAPTVHGNLRFFLAEGNDQNTNPIWWFGGGFDLTPYYAFEEDCIHWHTVLSRACQPFGDEIYPKFKQQCDAYFFLKHRNEARGIGGLFFDDLNEWPFEKCFDFIKNVGDHFLPGYLPIMSKRIDTPYGSKERDFQTFRRGRYVEFNLLYDRGTLFGLQSGGRTESILMSLPPVVTWPYDWQPQKDSPEEKLTQYFLIPQDWIKKDSTK